MLHWANTLNTNQLNFNDTENEHKWGKSHERNGHSIKQAAVLPGFVMQQSFFIAS